VEEVNIAKEVYTIEMLNQLQLFSVFTLVGTLLLVTPVFAQTASTTQDTGTTTASSSVTQATTTPMVLEPIASGKALSAEAQVRITNLAANISNRADALIARLNTITVRMESRANKLTIEGFDVSMANESIAQAKTSLANAHRAIGSIDTVVAESVSSENPQEAWKSVKNLFDTTKREILAAKQHLRDALAVMKNPTVPSTPAVEETATTTTP
jgi:hypothetical protein